MKNIRKIIYVFLILSSLIYADSEIDQKQNRINQIDKQVKTNEQKINTNKTNISNAQRSEKDIKNEINNITNSIKVIQAEYNELENKYKELLRKIGKNEEQINQSIREIEQSNYNIVVNKGNYSEFISLWDKLRKSTKINDVSNNEVLNPKSQKLAHDIKVILDEKAKTIKNYEKDKNNSEVTKKKTEEIKEKNQVEASSVEKAKKDLSSKKYELDKAKKAKDKAVLELQTLQNKLKAENTNIEKTNKNLIAEKKRLEEQIQKIIADALKQKELENKKKEEAIKNDTTKSETDKKASIDALSTENKGTGKLVVPLVGNIVVSYGQEKTEGLKSNGIEISGKLGQEIKAADSGKVIYAGSLNGLGSVIIIDHGGIVTVYGNLASVRVSKGTSVTKGQIIGTLGREAISKEPRLYFETRKGVNIVNPLGLL